jgi:hypothetical protein
MMIFQMEMLARDRQARLLEEAAESRLRRMAGGRGRSSVHPDHRLPRQSTQRR